MSLLLALQNRPPNTPSVTDATDTGAEQVTVTSSAFSDPDAGDTHAKSRWRIYTA